MVRFVYHFVKDCSVIIGSFKMDFINAHFDVTSS